LLLLIPFGSRRTPIWANLPSKNFLRDMAATTGFVDNFTNKLERVIGITRMYAGSIPLKIIASNIGHKNLNIIERYNQVNWLKTRVVQVFAKLKNKRGNFQDHLNVELPTWHNANIGNSQSSFALIDISASMNGRVAANDLEAINGRIRNFDCSIFATHKVASAPVRICLPKRNPSRPSFTACPVLLSLSSHSAYEIEQTLAVLVEEEMWFLSEY
jgi:hypothetical protein